MRSIITIGINIIIVILSLLTPLKGNAEVRYIDLTNPFLRKIPMAVPVFKSLTPSDAEKKLVSDVSDQVADMLEFSGYFKIIHNLLVWEVRPFYMRLYPVLMGITHRYISVCNR